MKLLGNLTTLILLGFVAYGIGSVAGYLINLILTLVGVF